ncbi:FAD:protein FMN transferase [Nakamurella sp. A5-74]|uniref:FAD:protein FMN transferase n=1 Tax=Nakamurella sp. A5-74 TaxID=3158264 RepID=A0AAU8DKC7_9ACTN
MRTLLERVDRVFSTYRPVSDVIRVRAGTPVEDVDPDVALVLQLAATAHRITGGLFDVREGAELDPSGVVKGWATGAAFADSGLGAFPGYLNAGGDLAVNGGPWRIGIEHPADPTGLLTVLAVTGGAVATSGSAHRGSHLWDPRTGQPVMNPWQATVVGPELVWADILATAAAVAGPETLDVTSWPADYEVLLCSSTGEVRTSRGFERWIAPDIGSLSSAELGVGPESGS